MNKHIPLFGTLAGATITAVAVVLIDVPQSNAYTIEQLYGAAPEYSVTQEEQTETQEDIAERTRDLIDRFTQQRSGSNQPTEPTQETVLDQEPFDVGPTESFSEAQGLDDDVSDLPSSGFGFSITTIALIFSVFWYRRKIFQFLSSARSNKRNLQL
ncbi:hypothetical protein HOD24_00920 [Candidatus Peregrinibacteria bacterium]|jgi:hypothetical protein|nr:hypothetical protein [Candidatus Peregrinibacteria bacterium]MBT4366934.1 hypothetical protein [Candidatus Peregrinibacteria bacterium]MBT4585686.1 hypothetical protein [Candidatus Peregrinibacteria bacterium]MBT6730451.1 hypothetical protein [Candidatus Peregrinibacteria bacterium]MBT7345284.1 hypothetical protein [Candidatus Peregrinibacteria bacterium]